MILILWLFFLYYFSLNTSHTGIINSRRVFIFAEKYSKIYRFPSSVSESQFWWNWCSFREFSRKWHLAIIRETRFARWCSVQGKLSFWTQRLELMIRNIIFEKMHFPGMKMKNPGLNLTQAMQHSVFNFDFLNLLSYIRSFLLLFYPINSFPPKF